jgi:hypothetical protein
MAALAGCERQPRAPALEDGTVYSNGREGFRFVVPDGWSQQAKADVPPGPVSKERVLVIYRYFGGALPATLQVSLVDLPETADLAEHLARPSEGIDWRTSARPEPLHIGGQAAKRYFLSGKAGKYDMAREVVALRRGGRVYFFSASFLGSDGVRREQVRETIAGVLWSR